MRKNRFKRRRRSLPRPFKGTGEKEFSAVAQAMSMVVKYLQDDKLELLEVKRAAADAERCLRRLVTSLKVRFALFLALVEVDDAKQFEKQHTAPLAHREGRMALQALSPLVGMVLEPSRVDDGCVRISMNGEYQLTDVYIDLKEFRAKPEKAAVALQAAINEAVTLTRGALKLRTSSPPDEPPADGEEDPLPDLYVGLTMEVVITQLNEAQYAHDREEFDLAASEACIAWWERDFSRSVLNCFQILNIALNQEERLTWEDRVGVDGISSVYLEATVLGGIHGHDQLNIGDVELEGKPSIRKLLGPAAAHINERHQLSQPELSIEPTPWLLERHGKKVFDSSADGVALQVSGNLEVRHLQFGGGPLCHGNGVAEAVKKAYNEASKEATNRLHVENMTRLLW